MHTEASSSNDRKKSTKSKLNPINRLKKGYVHIYTGNGKGKTTAALGQALRAAGSGLKTFIVMFLKDFSYGEAICIKNLVEWITIKQFGNDAFVICKQQPASKDIKAAQQELNQAREAMLSAKYDIVILDEVYVAIHYGLLKTPEVLSLLGAKPPPVELILTGRYCPTELIEMADLVTEMRESIIIKRA